MAKNGKTPSPSDVAYKLRRKNNKLDEINKNRAIARHLKANPNAKPPSRLKPDYKPATPAAAARHTAHLAKKLRGG